MKLNIKIKRVVSIAMALIMVVAGITCMPYTSKADDVFDTPIKLTGYEEYTFELTQPSKVSISLTNFSNVYNMEGVELYQLDEDENETFIVRKEVEYVESTSAVVSTDAIGLEPGRYVIKHRVQWSGQTAEMTIHREAYDDSCEIELNDSYSQATPININKEYSACMQHKDDVDYYKVELTQAGSFYINLRNAETDEEVWKVSLYSEDSNYNRTLINSWWNEGKKNTIFTKYRLTKGVYYIVVENGYLGRIGREYKIGTTVVYEDSENAEKENNDTIDRANSIKTNQEYKGNIQTLNDKDYFSFSLSNQADLHVTLRQNSKNIKKEAYRVSLYWQDAVTKRLVLYSRFTSESNPLSGKYTVKAPAGKYIVLVENRNGVLEASNDYCLKVEENAISETVKSPKVSTDSDGIQVATGTTFLVESNEGEEGGRYIFTLEDTADVDISLKEFKINNTLDLLTVYRVDEYGNDIEVTHKYFDYVSTTDEVSLDTMTLESGTYAVTYYSGGMGNSLGQNAYMTINCNTGIDLTNVSVSAIADQKYTGNYIYAKPIVKYNGKVLTENKDYVLEFRDNIYPGTATILIKAISGVSVGYKEVHFTIYEEQKTTKQEPVTEPQPTTELQTPTEPQPTTKPQTPTEPQESYEDEVPGENYETRAPQVFNGPQVVRREQLTNSVVIKKPSKVRISRAKNLKKRKIKLTWKKAKNVSKYQVRWCDAKSFRGYEQKTTSSTAITLRGLEKNKNYYIKIRAYKVYSVGKVYGSWSNVKKVKIKK